MLDIQKADKIYERLRSSLKGFEGKIIAIESDTGDYFIGETTSEAFQKGRQMHPRKQFLFLRIGDKATYRVGALAK